MAQEHQLPYSAAEVEARLGKPGYYEAEIIFVVTASSNTGVIAQMQVLRNTFPIDFRVLKEEGQVYRIQPADWPSGWLDEKPKAIFVNTQLHESGLDWRVPIIPVTEVGRLSSEYVVRFFKLDVNPTEYPGADKPSVSLIPAEALNATEICFRIIATEAAL